MTNDRTPMRDGSSGYREALAEVTADLTARELRAAQAEREARRERRSLLIDARGLALA